MYVYYIMAEFNVLGEQHARRSYYFSNKHNLVLLLSVNIYFLSEKIGTPLHNNVERGFFSVWGEYCEVAMVV